MAFRVVRKLRQLFDVDADAIADGETLVWDDGTETFVPAAAAGALDAAEVSFAPGGAIAATDVQAAIEEVAAEASGAPTGADYLVGTAQGGLSAEIVAGTSPGGELGGTWASPTVDATHSGSTHAAVQAAAEATAAAALSGHEADTTAVHGVADTAALYRAGGTAVAVADGGTGASTAANARTNLGLVIGTDVQAQDSDLAALAALSTTAFGRSLLELANQAALLSAAGAAAASHAHAGEDITSGTVADARIAATIARDAEVAAGYQPLDSDLTAIAALTTTAYGRSLLEAANAAALRTLGGLVIDTDVTAKSTFDAHLSDATAAHVASAVGFTPVGTIAATDAQAAIAEVAAEVSWRQIFTLTLGSAQATFDSNTILGGDIPQTYSQLRLKWIGQTSNAANQFAFIRFNNDSSAIYDYQYIDSGAATIGSAEGLAQTAGAIGVVVRSTATAMPGSGFVEIPWYTATTFHKITIAQSIYVFTTATGGIHLNPIVSRWRNTAAITRIQIFPGAGNWVTGSSIALYGIL